MSFEPTEVATVESPEPTDDEVNHPKLDPLSVLYLSSLPYSLPASLQALQKKMTSILPILRVNSHTHPVIGSHTATQDGIYEIVFDNSYSRLVVETS